MKSDKSLQHEWVYREYVNRENMFFHAPLEPEMDFYEAVASGKEAPVREYLKEDFLKKEGLGRLSDNAYRNGAYHFAITAALIARACIRAGLSVEESYSLSDFYIQKVDKLTSLSDITALHDEMVMDYNRRMNALNQTHKKTGLEYSKPVVNVINYIYGHLHTRITLDNLAAYSHLSPAYLSKLFKKETGMTISSYISEQKIVTAKNMLIYSDYTPAQIALILAFPSQSYFTYCFRRSIGKTPLAFSKTQYRFDG